VKIDRGDRLVSGLAGEKTRWEATLVELDARYIKLVGDCVLAAAFMSYCGPFPSEYRDELVADWITTVEAEKIPFDEAFEFHQFMAGEAVARKWQLNGLPTDKFSTENGVFVTKGLRWALNIDPQSQAMNWIKRTGEENGAKPGGKRLLVADSKDPDCIKKVMESVRLGMEVLL
jgi:dynein heavy chain